MTTGTDDSVSMADNHTSNTSCSTKTAVTNRTRSTREGRSIPPWVATSGVDFGRPTNEALQQPKALPRAAHPQQKRTTNELQRRVSKDGYEDWVDEKHMRESKLPRMLRKRADKPGRRWDHLRSAEPVIMGTGYRPPGLDPYAQWRDMIHSSSYGRIANEESEIVSPEFLHQLQPGLDNDVEAPFHPRDPKLSMSSRNQRYKSRFRDFVLRHPATPALFRLIVLFTSIAALAVAVTIYKKERTLARDFVDDDSSAKATLSLAKSEQIQALVAIIIDSIAIPYIMYMTWDEYTGKPLGLRPPVAKMTLTLLDLFFIIFKAASTALAFQVLVSRSIATSEDTRMLGLSKSLAAVMLVGLLAWIVNFTISVFRLVERLGGVDDDEGHH